MVVYADKLVGARGAMRCEVELSSQNQATNSSIVLVRGYIWLTSGGPSGDMSGGCKVSVTGTNSYGPIDGSFPNIYATTKRKMIEAMFTVPHKADGTKTVGYTFNFGPTITQNFGSGGSVTVYYDLPRIAKSPGPPSPPIATSAGGGSARVTWTAPNQGGSPIDYYHVMYADNNKWLPDNWHTVQATPGALYYDFSDLATKKRWYFWVAAHNSYGFSDWSKVSSGLYLDSKGPLVKSGSWRNSQSYVRYNGSWRPATAYTKSNGVWRPL